MSWRARVNAVLEVTAALKEEVFRLGSRHPLLEKVAHTSRLSYEGVLAGIEKSLEPYGEPRSSLDGELELLRERMLRVAKEDAPTHVVLSSNVFTASVRALISALAVSDRVRIAPSSRDPDFIEEIVKRSRLPIEVGKVQMDALASVQTHVYGSEKTVKLFDATKANVFGRGSGFGIGLLSREGGGTLDENLDAFALDMSLFDQRGCLSPRVLFTDGFDAEDVARGLFQALERRQRELPIGRLTDEELGERARFNLTGTYFGSVYSAIFGSVAVRGPLRIAPGARSIIVMCIGSIKGETEHERVTEALGPLREEVTILGTNLDVSRVAPGFPRVARFGNMQSPPLDGPADLRGL